jgi:ferredoxin
VAKAFVDVKRCQGHGRCELIAPRLFTVTDLGVSSVLADEIDPGDMDSALEAEHSCPEQAITVE